MPCHFAPVSEREHLQERASPQLHYQTHPLVSVGNLTVELIVLSPEIFLHVWSYDISAHVAVEKPVERHVSGERESFPHLSALYSYEGLVAPFVAPEYPSRHHLFGRKSLVRSLSVNLLCEINGECVERTYTVVVQYEKTSETVSHVLRQCVRSGVCRHHGEEQSRSRESRPFLRKHPDDATVRAFRVGEHPKK